MRKKNKKIQFQGTKEKLFFQTFLLRLVHNFGQTASINWLQFSR